MKTGPVLAIDLGGTNIRAAVVGADGEILAHVSTHTPATRGADAVVEAIGQAADQVIAQSPIPSSAPAGLCSPGPLDAEAGIALNTPTITGFRDFPLRQAVAERLGRPVVIDNDGHAAAIGEWHFGVARGQRNFVYLTFSTGIGGAAVVDGHLTRGRRGLAGHFGHILTGNHDDYCSCGRAGCWEASASGTALQLRAKANGYANLEAVFHADRQGDPEARGFLEAATNQMARGIVSLAHAFSPDVIVLGGGVMTEFATLHPMLGAHFQALCMPSFRPTQLVKAELGDRAGVMGMAVEAAGLI